MSLSSPRRADVVRRVLAFVVRGWRRRVGLVSALVAAITLATLADVMLPLYAGRLVDALAGAERQAALQAALPAFAIMTALSLATVLLRHVAWSLVVPLTLGTMSDIASQSFARVQRFSTEWHANTFSGSTVRKISRGMWALDGLNDVLLLSILPSVVVLLGTTVVLGLHWPAMGAVIGLGTLAYVGTAVFLATRVIAPAATLSNALDTRLGGALSDTIGNNAVVKAFGAEAREDERLARVLSKWRRRTRRTWMIVTWSGTLQLGLLLAFRSAIVATALWLWWQGQASPGEVAYVLTTYFVVHGYLRDIGGHINHLQRSVNEMEELVALEAEPVGVADRPGAVPLAVSGGAIRFDAVRFHYGTHGTPLYDGLSVTIPAGQRVGLVGRSGSGKTTFVKLIQRLYDVSGGHVRIDGQDVAGATQASLRAQVAIVPQEPVLFHRSLAENIAYARPGASPEEIERAARLANAHDFIARLPKGYATLVGERGVKLSGGERQRVALARAFLADAPILILDEATSSLDSESEALVQEAMERLMRGRTAIVIAHRLSTVRALDRILVFDRGRIVEDGAHAALMRRPNGAYRALFERQSELAENA
ncbi:MULTISPECIES: ABC transporter ATP-binding protein [Methylorubrum]|jgi:ATP-binding cassette, subfamily B, bacterial|uniref:ABC transporter, fused ATPase and permease domains n=2 Tax=Methylorubrum extorquens TaxID=408 RepID=C5AVS4_METEA|nr:MULTISPECIES: ABC transporter ATP-binding protein [Methylorubrum]ACS40760.1 putative ABC transporter, fused ATPase and permease domains [Methylorubrum extorquens AM1]EHP94165.1 Xenobiotic-transporting ATPase [Methylorubrum extorquens DSM 13060]MCP1541085.1 ATP-binding cassette subfamily B protein [Methylorubrum extorquens]MCP1586378.1 ATP-binding cassette subfamily B protein [Methylorubrum extorquens]BDL40178.1 multidrug ABC transporter ATP-binding protein [Methylorubrum sp. GM97]